MKNSLITILLTISSTLFAQEELPYKPLSEFGTDTTAFMRYNFIDRENYYIGKTLGDVIDDMQVSVTDILLSFGLYSRENLLYGMSLRILNKERISRMLFNDLKGIYSIYSIYVNWDEDPIEKDEKIKEMYDTGLNDVDAALNYLRTFKNKISAVSLVNVPDEGYYTRHVKDTPTIVGDTLIWQEGH